MVVDLASQNRSAHGADQQPLTTAAPKRRDFVQAWRTGTRRMQRSRMAILDARELEDGSLTMTSPDVALAADGTTYDPYASRLPQRTLLPLQLEQQVADLMCDILREPGSGSETADAQAQKLESWLRAEIEMLLPWRDSVGKAVRDGEWASYLMPASAAWERRPTWMDAQSESIRRDWWVDADGASTRQRDRVDRSKSFKAFSEAYTRFISTLPPATYRLISATDCVPNFTRGWGKRRWELSSLLVRQLYDVDELLAGGYQWEGMDRMLLPTGFAPDNTVGQCGMAYLYEWFYYAPNPENPYDQIPMVSYSVGGMDTYNPRQAARDDTAPAEATINLRERYGMQRHLMGYYWGLRRAGEDNPDRIGIPFMTAWRDTILGVEMTKMATKKHAFATGFGGHQFVPDPNIPAETYTQGADGGRTMRQFALPASGEAVSVPGEFRPVAPGAMTPVVNYLIETDMALLSATAPSSQQYGGDGASSGHELSVSHALFQSANSHIREGLRLQVEDLSSWLLELADTLMETFDLDGIPALSNQPATADAAPGRRSPRERLVLTRGMIGGNYLITAFYPKVGNLMEIAQEKADWMDGASTLDRVAEAKGINDPFTFRVEIERDKFLQSEQGQALVALWMARYRGDDEQAQKMIDAGVLNPDGQTPMAAIDPEAMAAASGAVDRAMGGGAPGGGMEPGSAAFGGAMAGAMQSGAVMSDAAAVSDIQTAPQARMVGQ